MMKETEETRRKKAENFPSKLQSHNLKPEVTSVGFMPPLKQQEIYHVTAIIRPVTKSHYTGTHRTLMGSINPLQSDHMSFNASPAQGKERI